MIILYVKTHNITGLKYFGKTTKPDPEKYKGSGIYWKKHIKKHGYDVKTEIIGTFDNEELCNGAALKFSIDNNIVESYLWANLRDENGLDGAPKGHVGHKFTEDELSDMSNKLKLRWEDPEYRSRLIESHKNRWTDDLKEKQSKRLTGKLRPEHSKTMTGRTGHHNGLGVKKKDGHGANVSAATKGVPKSIEHRKKLSGAKPRICRLTDKKEMSVNHFTRWLISIESENH